MTVRTTVLFVLDTKQISGIQQLLHCKSQKVFDSTQKRVNSIKNDTKIANNKLLQHER